MSRAALLGAVAASVALYFIGRADGGRGGPANSAYAREYFARGQRIDSLRAALDSPPFQYDAVYGPKYRRQIVALQESLAACRSR